MVVIILWTVGDIEKGKGREEGRVLHLEVH